MSHPNQPYHVGPDYGPGQAAVARSHYQPFQAPPWPPLRQKKRFWTSTGGVFTIVGIILGSVFLVCGGLLALGLVSDSTAAKKMDVKLTSCSFENDGFLPSATVEYTVKNTGDTARGALIRIEYRDGAGNRVDTDTAYVQTIQPGDTVRAEETTMLDAAVSPGSGKCAIVGVD